MRAFALLTATLFASYYFLETPPVQNERTIRLDPATEAAAIDRRAELFGRALTEAEREEALKDYIDDAILLEEAYRRGYDRGDPEVRRVLIERMRQTLAGYPLAATDAQARDFFDAHRDRYVTMESLTLDHVFSYADTDPGELLSSLRSGANMMELSALGLDETLSSAQTLPNVSRVDLSRSLGREIASHVFELPLDEWHGPFQSRVGTHYLRVRKRLPSRPQPYEDVAWVAGQDWSREKHQEALDATMPPLRERYRVEIER